MLITIVDYDICNVGSLRNIFKKIGVPVQVSGDPDIVAKAEKLVLPGVGSFDAGMDKLNNTGLAAAIKHAVIERGVFALGICLGMQLMCRTSEEGSNQGLCLVDADVKKLARSSETNDLRIPHMGWNSVATARQHGLFNELETGSRFYFVHSYRVVCDDDQDILGTTNYGQDFTSCYAHKNILGVQFHPEKSNRFGIKMLQNFSEI